MSTLINGGGGKILPKMDKGGVVNVFTSMVTPKWIS